MTVCAVVVTYNRAALLADALGALRAGTRRVDHLVVVDNASADGTADVLARFPEAEVVRLPENAGASGGFAAGIARAAGGGWDWVWMMDDDVLPRPDALEALLATGLLEGPGAAALTPLKVGVDGRVQAAHAGTFSLARMRTRGIDAAPGDAPVRVGYATFVGLLVRGSVARLELPRADFFFWYDDVEYTLRLARHGSLHLVPASVIVHRDGEASGDYRRVRGRRVTRAGTWRVYYGLRNRMLTLRAHGTRLQRAAGLGWAAFYLARSVATTFVHYGGDRLRLRLLLRAYADGLRGRAGKRVDPARP